MMDDEFKKEVVSLLKSIRSYMLVMWLTVWAIFNRGCYAQEVHIVEDRTKPFITIPDASANGTTP